MAAAAAQDHSSCDGTRSIALVPEGLARQASCSCKVHLLTRASRRKQLLLAALPGEQLCTSPGAELRWWLQGCECTFCARCMGASKRAAGGARQLSPVQAARSTQPCRQRCRLSAGDPVRKGTASTVCGKGRRVSGPCLNSSLTLKGADTLIQYTLAETVLAAGQLLACKAGAPAKAGLPP